MAYEDLKKQLEWFNQVGIEEFNFSVLEKGMTNDVLPRNAGDVMKAAGWAWARNAEKMLNVYLRPDISCEQAWPVIFIDDLPLGTVAAISKKYASLILETSKGNHQAWIQTNQPLGIPQRLEVQSQVAAKVGGDPGSTSGKKFGRAACYLNRKPGRNNWPVRLVVATRHHHLLFDPQPYLNHALPPPTGGAGALPANPSRRTTGNQAGNDKSESAKEWGWALGWLRSGCDIEKGIQKLTARALARGKRQDEHQARKYAVLTFDRAKAVVRYG